MFTLSFIKFNTKAIVSALVIGFAFMMIALIPSVADANYSQGSYSSSRSGSVVNVAPFCGAINRSLAVGARDASTGNQVSALQGFLALDAEIYPEGEITGFFGPQTQRAVQRFQTRYGVVSSGTPDTTGYGSVGARTRAVIDSICQSLAGDEDEDEDEDEENDIDTIDEIVVYLDKATKRAEVNVVINSAPDLTFTHTYVSQTKAITFIGEKLESSYGFDFSEFRTDRLRDSRLKRLVEWEYEEEDEDEDILTLSDIRRIDVTSSADEDGYVDVSVDLREDDDFSFDIVEGTEGKMVIAIAEKLENSYEFDFDEYSSDRNRDAQVKKLIDWNLEEDADSAVLRIEGEITGGCQRAGACSSFVLNGRAYTYTEGLIMTCLSLDCQKVRSVSGTLSASLYEQLVDSLTTEVLIANSKVGTQRTVACASYVDGNDYSYAVTRNGGTEYNLHSCNTAFASNNALQTMLKKTWSEMSKQTVSDSYTINDVKSVTSKSVDPIPGAIDDEYALYTITLDSGVVHEVKVHGMVPFESNVRQFKATGYTGDVEALMKLAVKLPDNTDTKLAVAMTPSTGLKQGDTVKLTWSPKAVGAEDGMYVVLKDAAGNAVASKKIESPKSGLVSYKIPAASDFCNNFFSDALGQCGDITKAKNGTSFTITISTFTPKSACFGYCAPSSKTAKILQTAVTSSFSLGGATSGSYGLTDVKSVTSKYVDPTPQTTSKTGVTTNTFDDEYTVFTITLNSGVKHEVKRYGFGLASTFENAVKATGYTGDVAKLVALAKVSTPSDATMCLNDGTYYKEGTQTTKVINSDGTAQGIADGYFTCSKGKWVTRGSLPSEQPKTPFNIDDIKTVVSRFIDPTPSKTGDEYTRYDMTLDNGTKRSVDINFGSYSKVESSFKDIGYTGSVWDVTIKATRGTESSSVIEKTGNYGTGSVETPRQINPSGYGNYGAPTSIKDGTGSTYTPRQTTPSTGYGSYGAPTSIKDVSTTNEPSRSSTGSYGTSGRTQTTSNTSAQIAEMSELLKSLMAKLEALQRE